MAYCCDSARRARRSSGAEGGQTGRGGTEGGRRGRGTTRGAAGRREEGAPRPPSRQLAIVRPGGPLPCPRQPAEFHPLQRENQGKAVDMAAFFAFRAVPASFDTCSGYRSLQTEARQTFQQAPRQRSSDAATRTWSACRQGCSQPQPAEAPASFETTYAAPTKANKTKVQRRKAI